MACTTGQTSAILDCICVNGKPLIEYIDGGDQALQQLIATMNSQITSLQACCTSHSQVIATLQGLVTTIQGEITALQTCCTSHTAAMATIQGMITTLQGQITALQNAITALQAQAHPRLTLTQNQDVTGASGARATLDVTGQVLNLPPAIYKVLSSTTLHQTLPSGLGVAQITGLAVRQDSYDGQAEGTPADSIRIPRPGWYQVLGSWATASAVDPCADFVLGITLGVNGSYRGRYTAPGTGLGDQVFLALPAQLAAGDRITLGAYTTCPAVPLTTAYLTVHYVEGT